MPLKGYTITEQIHKGSNSFVFKAVRQADNKPVIIKTMAAEHPSQTHTDKFRNQFDITRDLNIPGIITMYDLVKHQNGLAIIMEDINGADLRKTLKNQKIDVTAFLRLAVRLAGILQNIHDNNIIHKDIKPDNIIVTPDFKEVRIIDFSISTKLSAQRPDIVNENVLEGTLSYISPEQTGRMNRPVDYRSDFYSLGITFYELLMGEVPFKANDALGMIHLHIAGIPGDPHKLNKNIPEQVSRIIRKLLAKNAEDRYWSAQGLKNDLEKCRLQFVETGKIKEFPLAIHDYSPKFQISPKLYGRASQIDVLLNTYSRALEGESPMLLVAGPPGTGKSALIQEIYKPNVKNRGFFVSGKFEQFNRNIPFSAIIQAFDQLIQILLRTSDEEINRWKEKILAALGDNGQIIIDMIPALELIIGKQPAVPKLGPMETQNRFTHYFQGFTSVFTGKEHPLSIFLDDLQWADRASLNLMKTLITNKETGYLLLLGAYRDNEVDRTHPLLLTLREIKKEEVEYETLTLPPLSKDDVHVLITDSLKCSRRKSLMLAELVFKKTKGNPFFTGHFLKNLYSRKLLSYDRSAGWKWDIEMVERLAVTDNVVTLLADKIKELTSSTAELLEIASCMGNNFSFSALTLVYKKPREEILHLLTPLMEEGFLFSQNNRYYFSHDRIQEAVYSLIPGQVQKELHYKIGRLELESVRGSDPGKRLFYIVDQLNSGIDLITDETELTELAGLNLKAGQKALESTAYQPALKYLNTGIGLITPGWWQDRYELAFPLFTYGAEAAFLNTNFEQMEKRIEEALQYIDRVSDRARLYEIKIIAYASKARHLEAIETGHKILKELGVSIPKNPGKLHILKGMLKAKLALKGKTMEDLRNLPALDNRKILSILRILTSLGTSLYYAQPAMVPLSVLKMVYLTVKHGNSAYSPYIFAAYGFIIAGVLGQVDSGCSFGELALHLIRDLDARQHIAKVTLIFYHMTKHWKVHLKKILTPLLEGYKRALEVGDLEYAGICLYSYLADSVFAEKERRAEYDESIHYLAIAGKLKHEKAVNSISRIAQFHANLTGRNSTNRCRLQGDEYDEDKMFAIHRKNSSHTDISMICLFDLILCYLFGEYEKAVEHGMLGYTHIQALLGVILTPEFTFYYSLSLLAHYGDVSKKKQVRYLKQINRNQKKMKSWAANAPMNHLHKYYLVEAELARVKGHIQETMDYYEKAIELAGENEYIHEQAVAYECAAGFYLEQKRIRFAALYIKESKYCFERWGAAEKVKQLEETYPSLLADRNEKGIIKNTIETMDATSTGTNLDVNTLLKASRTLSGEIELAKLLKKMMRLVIENAGAQRGILILEDNGTYYIEAEAMLGERNFAVMQSIPTGEYKEYSRTVINYVMHSKESFVTGEAYKDKNCLPDEYIKKNKIRSLLCFPIIHQTKLLALIYLENNLTANAFTANRLDLLKSLSAQIVISTTNARLYDNLEQKVNQRTVELRSVYGKLELQHEKLRTVNKQVMDSIVYAQRIQRAILPGKKDINTVVSGYFVLWKPRDIVGGDFYWFKKVEKGFFLAVIDCTGHGIPGAFMTMIGRGALDHIITHICDNNPARILKELNRNIKETLNQNEKESPIDDGMDAALCYIQPERRKLTFAGARLPLYFCQKGECYEVRGNKQSLGYISSSLDYDYTNHDISLKGDEVFYLSSDGYTDQAGGEMGFGFGRKKFKKLLAEHHTKKMKTQKSILETSLKKYRQDNPKLDDITVMGFIPRLFTSSQNLHLLRKHSADYRRLKHIITLPGQK